MMHLLARTKRLAAAALWLAMMAVVSAALVPPGWMVSADVDGAGFRVEICTGQGARTVTIGPDGEILPGGEAPRVHDSACAFAQAVQAFCPSDERFAVRRTITVAAPALVHQASRLKRAVDPHQARGPPAPGGRTNFIKRRA